MSRLEPSTVAELEAWLRAAGMPLDEWGTGGAKSVSDLRNEITAGESILESNPFCRAVELVQLRIVRDDRVLIELEQELAGGRRRQRRRLPSEKVKRGETPIQAAHRCLKEELGLKETKGVGLSSDNRPIQSRGESPSYPGLITHYTIHTITALLDDLPEDDFWVENVAKRDPVVRHRWGWQQIDDTPDHKSASAAPPG